MTTLHRTHSDMPAKPVWEVATLFPMQGDWTEQAYLDLTAESNRPIELSDGHLEFLPVPKASHQRILQYLLGSFLAFIHPNQLGEMLPCPLRVRLREGRFREPDLVFMAARNAARAGDDFWEGADLVVEIVSDEGRDRDLIEKRSEYAQAGIAEYWTVDPKENRIEVLTLQGTQYGTHGEFKRGASATSQLLEGFSVDVATALDAAHKRG